VRRLLPFALALLLALTLIPGLAAIEAIDWREARDAEVARESTSGEQWFTPFLGHEAFFEKPLPGYGHEVLARRLLHRIVATSDANLTDVATSRAVRAGLAALLALLVAVIGTRAFGARAGWLAGCALASSVGLPLATRTDGAQLVATLCAWLGAGGLLALVRGRAKHAALTRYASWLALAAAMLTGGPFSALWPVAGFGLYFALARDRAGWRELRPLPGLAIVIGLALPWYGAMTALYGPRFLSHVAWFPYAMETRGPWVAGPLLALSFTIVLGFPWTPLLGASLSDAAARLRRPVDGPRDLRDPRHAASLMIALLFCAALPVAMYPGPPLTAALPALPAIALLCGRFLDRVLDGDIDARHLTGATRLTAFIGTAVSLLAMMLAASLPDAAAGLRLLAAVLLVTSWSPLLADLLDRRRIAAALFALPVALGAPIVLARVLPELEPWLNTREVADAMLAVAPERAPLALLEPALPSLRLLLPRNLVVVPDVSTSLAPLAARDHHAYLAFPPAREHEVARRAGTPIEILLRTPTLVLVRVSVEPAAMAAPAAPPGLPAAH